MRQPDPTRPIPSIGNLPTVGASMGDSPTAADDGTDIPEATAVSAVAGFQILGELGRGGMGVVYKARHLRLNRLTALKLILAGGHTSSKARSRFRAEAEAVARLRHPGIVQVYEVGEEGGLPWCALEYCPGGTLADRIGEPMPAREAAGLVRQLAQAVQHAHTHNVVHRDLKPANVLVAEDGTLKVTDFGLAKFADGEDEGMTASGAVMGTPSHMAPEQARGESRSVGPAADIWALGVILYECLTGHRPFRGESVQATLARVLTEEPPALGRGVPGDLAVICLKCLRKEPGERYLSADALADDLRRFLHGEPVTARPVGRVERSIKWVRRNPALAVALALVAICLSGATAVSVGFGLLAERSRRLAEQAGQKEAERAESESRAKGEAEAAKHDAQRQLIELCGASGLTAAREGDQPLALLWFCRAAGLASDTPDLLELNRIRAGNWLREVSSPAGMAAFAGFRNPQDHIRALEFSPNGDYLLATATTGEPIVFRVGSDRPVRLPADVARGEAIWEPKSGWLAVAGDAGVQLLAPPDFRTVEKIATEGRVSTMAFDREGRRLAWVEGTSVRVWDRDSRGPIGPNLEHPATPTTIAFSQSGLFLATSALDKKARVFRVGAKGEPLFPPVPHDRKEHGHAHGGPDRVAPRFADEDRVLLTVERDTSANNSLVWRSATTGGLLKSCPPPPSQGFMNAFDVSPRGDRVAAMWESNGQLWEASTQEQLANVVLGERYTWCEDVRFASGGKSLVTAGHNMRVQFWSTDPPPSGVLAPSTPATLHPIQVVRAVVSPTGKHFASATADGRVYLWNSPAGLRRTASIPAGGVTLPVLSPDSRWVMAGGTTYRHTTQTTTRVHEARTGEPAGPTLAPGGLLLNSVFSPDGSLVATASSTAGTISERAGRLFLPDGKAGSVQLWNWKSGRRVVEPIPMPSEPRGLAFRPDGRMLAAVCADYRVVLIDPRTGEIAHRLDPGIRTRPSNANLWWGNGEARFSPDGRTLVTWELAGPMHVWDADSGRLRHTLPHDDRVESVAFHPGEPRILATAGRENYIRVWDLTTGSLLASLPQPGRSARIKFSPDGTEIHAGCIDGMFRVWDWKAGKLTGGLARLPTPIHDFALTADRRWLVTLGMDQLQLTDWRSRTPAGPEWHLGTPICLGLGMPAGDERMIVGGFTKSLEVYDLRSAVTPPTTSPEEMIRLAELASGRRILGSGQVVPLSGADWDARWARSR